MNISIGRNLAEIIQGIISIVIMSVIIIIQ